MDTNKTESCSVVGCVTKNFQLKEVYMHIKAVTIEKA